MTKVLIVGDTHGSPTFVSNIHRYAREVGAKVIVQLGDFGYTFDRNVLASITAWLDRDPEHQWYWLDGNHDEHTYIEEMILKGEYTGSPVSHFHERMFYCHRGSTTMIGDKLCMFMGGAYSIDKHHRVPHVSWWPQEMIRQSDVHRALTNADGRKIDVVFSHDAPSTLTLETWLSSEGYKSDANSSANRDALSYVVDQVRPDHVYHGHFHVRYDAIRRAESGWLTEVHGVAANIDQVTFFMDNSVRPGNNVLIEEW